MCLSVLNLCRGTPWQMWSIWLWLPSPPLGTWLQVWAPGVGTFFCRRNGTKSHHHMLICVVTVEKNVGVLEVSTCFQGINQLLRTHFQYILIEFLTCGDCVNFWIFRLTIKHWNSNISNPLTARNYASLEMNRHLKGKTLQHYTKVGIFDLTPSPAVEILTKFLLKSWMSHTCPGYLPLVKHWQTHEM